MVTGIGIDIVEVRRITKALEGSGAMVRRVFTPEEIKYCSGRKNQYEHFAGRFAAKEAALKALGTGWQGGIRWTDVEVSVDEMGKPQIGFHGKALELFEQASAKRALLSITHSKEHAVAVVVLDADVSRVDAD
jgi:holo-[acyl-carrier protein] synthase